MDFWTFPVGGSRSFEGRASLLSGVAEAKNKIVQVECVLEAMGGMEGPAVQAIKMELEEGR